MAGTIKEERLRWVLPIGNGEMGEMEKWKWCQRNGRTGKITRKKAPAVTACHASRLPAFAASVMGEVR